MTTKFKVLQSGVRSIDDTSEDGLQLSSFSLKDPALLSLSNCSRQESPVNRGGNIGEMELKLLQLALVDGFEDGFHHVLGPELNLDVGNYSGLPAVAESFPLVRMKGEVNTETGPLPGRSGLG